MTKNQLIDVVARKAKLTKKAARDAIDSLLDEIQKTLSKGDKVVVSGFGTFKVVSVKDKPVIVPGTGERKIVKAHRAARFSPGKTLKRTVK
jgi:nucleoid DNA-binding protein